MACLLTHNWGWPRRRGDQDLQTCIHCGAQRLAPIQFGKALPVFCLESESVQVRYEGTDTASERRASAAWGG